MTRTNNFLLFSVSFIVESCLNTLFVLWVIVYDRRRVISLEPSISLSINYCEADTVNLIIVFLAPKVVLSIHKLCAGELRLKQRPKSIMS